jgi:hypothetical protein
VLPQTAVHGFWRNGGFAVAGSSGSHYEVEAAPLTAFTPDGTTARFVISGTLLDGSAAAGLAVRYAWHKMALPPYIDNLRFRAYGPNDEWKTDLNYGTATLDSRGNAVITVPAIAPSVELYAFDPDTQELTTVARTIVGPQKSSASPAEIRVTGVVDGGGDAIYNLTLQSALSTNNRGALIMYGSDYLFYAQSARFNSGIAHVSVRAPDQLDDFKVAAAQPNQDERTWGYGNIVKTPKRHLLHVTLGCISHGYLCVHISSWRGTVEGARIFIGVTATTQAAIINALGRSNEAYAALYTPLNVDYNFTVSWPGTQPLSKSYLYPVSLPPSTFGLRPAGQARPTTSPTPEAPRVYASQTAVWLNNLTTNSIGSLKLSLAGELEPDRLWLVHVIAVGPRGEIGEAFAWAYGRPK